MRWKLGNISLLADGDSCASPARPAEADRSPLKRGSCKARPFRGPRQFPLPLRLHSPQLQMGMQQASCWQKPLVRFSLLFFVAFVSLALALTAGVRVAFGEESEGNIVDPTQRADNSFIYDTTIESLFDQASLYDARTVQVVGEVVGDRIETNDGTGNCWVMLTSVNEDNSTSISVLLSAEQASQIDHYGRYGVTGTTLQVRGTYHQTCGEHDGLPDLHATNSSVLAKGSEHPDDLALRDFVPGVLAVAIGLILLGVFYVARERMR